MSNSLLTKISSGTVSTAWLPLWKPLLFSGEKRERKERYPSFYLPHFSSSLSREGWTQCFVSPLALPTTLTCLRCRRLSACPSVVLPSSAALFNWHRLFRRRPRNKWSNGQKMMMTMAMMTPAGRTGHFPGNTN